MQPSSPKVLSRSNDKVEHKSDPLTRQPSAQPLYLGMFEIGKLLVKGDSSRRVYLAREREHGFICARNVLKKSELREARVEK